MANRLKERYDNEVFNGLKERFNYDNVMEIPKLEKITVNIGLGQVKDNQKIFSIALPRLRDFKGVSRNSFDGRGNYTIGLKEQLIFPEIEYDKIEKIMGMDITFTTTAKTDEEAFALLEMLGMPFEK